MDDLNFGGCLLGLLPPLIALLLLCVVAVMEVSAIAPSDEDSFKAYEATVTVTDKRVDDDSRYIVYVVAEDGNGYTFRAYDASVYAAMQIGKTYVINYYYSSLGNKVLYAGELVDGFEGETEDAA